MTNQEILIREKNKLGVETLKSEKEWEKEGYSVKPWCKDDAHTIKLWFGIEKETKHTTKDLNGNETVTKDVEVFYKKQPRKLFDEGQVQLKEA